MIRKRRLVIRLGIRQSLQLRTRDQILAGGCNDDEMSVASLWGTKELRRARVLVEPCAQRAVSKTCPKVAGKLGWLRIAERIRHLLYAERRLQQFTRSVETRLAQPCLRTAPQLRPEHTLQLAQRDVQLPGHGTPFVAARSQHVQRLVVTEAERLSHGCCVA